jgi:hypothetical protein
MLADRRRSPSRAVSNPPLAAHYLADPRIHRVDAIAVAAPPDVAWAHARAIDLRDIAIVRVLLELRMIPARLDAWFSGESIARRARLRIDDLIAPGSGFTLLAEEPGREIVIGSVGAFWRPDIEWRYVAADELAAFAEPGWGKLAWSLRVEALGRGSLITCELRVTATDDASWTKLRRYWRVTGPFSLAIRRALLGRLADELGHLTRPAA